MKDKKVAAATGRIGGYTTAGRYDPREYTKPAHAGFAEKFRREALEADPSLADNPEELERRAQSLLSAYMSRLAYASVKARAAKKATP